MNKSSHAPLSSLLDFVVTLYKKGGIRLKLIGFTLAIIITTVTILNLIIINLMTNSIEKKSFDVVTESIKQIGYYSRHALLERSYENKLNLDEIIKNVKKSEIEGILDISIYERIKKNDKNQYSYIAGFNEIKSDNYLNNSPLINKLNNSKSENIIKENVRYNQLEAFQFVMPILYNFKKETITLGAIVLHYNQEAIYGVINKIIIVSIFITLFIILLTTIIVYYSGSLFTRPILAISNAAVDVSNGNLNIDDLKIESNDEIGVLTQRFNSMINGLRERQHMEKFVSNSTINMIQKDSKQQLILGGEYQTLTILFSDIRGFTAMSEKKEPKEVLNIVNFYLNMQSEIIKKHNGDIDKFVGDEVMASFSGNDATLNAVNCALEIQNTIRSQNQLREKTNEVTCNVGIGINKGKVIVGNVGSDERMDFTAIGSEVNLAARLCSSAKADEILIEEETANDIKDKFNIILKEAIQVKGFDKLIKINSVEIKG